MIHSSNNKFMTKCYILLFNYTNIFWRIYQEVAYTMKESIHQVLQLDLQQRLSRKFRKDVFLAKQIIEPIQNSSWQPNMRWITDFTHELSLDNFKWLEETGSLAPLFAKALIHHTS